MVRDHGIPEDSIMSQDNLIMSQDNLIIQHTKGVTSLNGTDTIDKNMKINQGITTGIMGIPRIITNY